MMYIYRLYICSRFVWFGSKSRKMCAYRRVWFGGKSRADTCLPWRAHWPSPRKLWLPVSGSVSGWEIRIISQECLRHKCHMFATSSQIQFTAQISSVSQVRCWCHPREKGREGADVHLKYNVTSGSGRAQVLCDEVHFCFTRFFVYKLLQCYSFLTFPSPTGLVWNYLYSRFPNKYVMSFKVRGLFIQIGFASHRSLKHCVFGTSTGMPGGSRDLL